jgi:hypothetical protein
VLCVLTGCGGEGPGDPQASAPSSTRGPPDRTQPAAATEEIAPQVAPAQAPTTQPVAAPEPPAAAAAPPAEEAPKRDFGAELSAAVGDLSKCVEPRTASDTTAAGAKLSIALEVVVTESGIVTRSSVRAPGLDPGELDCVRERLSRVRVRSPVEEAPRTIRADVSLTLQATAQPDSPPTSPEAPPTGAGYP